MNLTTEEQVLRDEVFWEELQGYSIDQIEEAFGWARKELKFFPTPTLIIDHILTLQDRKYLSGKEIYEIEWMEPTEKGKKLAKELYESLKARWAEAEKQEEEQRKIRFEKRKAEIKKQSKLILKGG